MPSVERLYTTQVLSLATGLAATPFDAAMGHVGTARSASCGSMLSLSLATGPAGRVVNAGVRAQACAIGQAAAAIFVAAVRGFDRDEISHSLHMLESWLSGEGALPDWPGLDAIAQARAFPGRHGAILLPWKAALEALPSA